MNHRKQNSGRIGFAAALLAGLALAAPVSHAQQPAQPAQPAKKAQQPAQANQQAQNSWVKLCQDKDRVKDGVITKTKICLTHHERLSATNGMVLVSAAIRTISGLENEHLMVLVPLGVALPPGLQLVVDDNKPIPLKFTFCHVGGCTAEAIAKKELVENFKKGKQIKVLALNNVGKTVVFPVPLAGFTKAYEGEPVDTKKYAEARKKLMKMIQQRQIELAKKAAEAKKQEGDKAAPQAPAKKPQ